MIAIHVSTVKDSDFVHLASTMEKAKEWILKHGQDWTDEKYCFFAYPVKVDKDSYYELGEDYAVYIDTKGETSHRNPLFDYNDYND